MKPNKNFLDLLYHSEGNERRYEMFGELFDKSTILPKTLTYKDIDEAFIEWAKKDIKIISPDGVEFPTMSLFSSQKFSEYSQSWEYVDENNNLILNFKTVTRDNNPQHGTIVGNIYNIPDNKFYLMKRHLVLDDNGTESIVDLKMKLPVPIDLIYKVTAFTTKFETLNEFNRLINSAFSSRQCYICPNGHYIPMVLDSVDDKTEYSIDDRQFYGQTVQIKVLGYLINEDDFKVEERPLKLAPISTMFKKSKKADVEIEEPEDNPCVVEVDDKVYYYKPLTLTINFDKCIRNSEFTMDCDFVIDQIFYDNVQKKLTASINDDEIKLGHGIKFKKNDVVKIKTKKRVPLKESVLTIYGYDPNVVYDEDNDNMESTLDEKNISEEIVVNN